MSQLLTLPDIARELAVVNGCDAATAERFLREFFATVSTGLASDRVVKVKGFGTFTVSGHGEGLTVDFDPDPDIADTINAPFAMFEPMELADGVTEEILCAPASFDGEAEPEPEADQPEAKEAEEEMTTPEEVENVAAESEGEEVKIVLPPCQPAVEETEETSPDPATEPEPTIELKYVINPPSEEEKTIPYVAPEYERKRSPFPAILWAFVAFVIGCFVGYFSHDHINNPPLRPADPQDIATDVPDEEILVAEDTVWEVVEIAEEPAKIAPILTDTVRPGRFLTTMSRKYFGAMEFWVYIYEENRSKLGHPDQIAPNTVVVIPTAEKYGIDPNSKESLNAARAKAAEIYNDYQK